MTTAEPIPSELPLAFDATPESLLQDAETIIKSTMHIWDGITQNISPQNATIENLVLPVALNDNETKIKSALIHFAASTHPSEAMRNASNEGDRLLDELNTELYTRDHMYQLVDIVLKQTDPSKVDPETYRFLQKHHAEFIRNGCGLPQSEKEKFGAHKMGLVELVRQYLKNLNSDQNGLWLSPEELDGVPVNTIEKLQKGEGDNAGKLWVTMKTPHTVPVLRFANLESTRKRVYTASLNRVPENVALHREIILLRDVLGRQLGFRNWADLRTSEKTVRSTKTVTDFLDRIRPPLMAGAEMEARELLNLKKADLPDNDEIRLYYWDQAFYERVRDEKAASLDLRYASEFFELSHVLREMLNIYETLFDIEFELVTPERYESITHRSASTMVWQEDVKLYVLWDVTQEPSFLAYLYFDLHPRPGKFTHAGHYCLQPGFIRQDGTRKYPSSALVMNYAKPTDLTPSLMALNDVRSLFHELGHAMHNLLSHTKFARFHGSKVDRDFVETPSLLFEHFFWTKSHIKDVACHYSYISDKYKTAWEAKQDGINRPQPPQQLPDELISGILSLKLSNKPLALARQLHFAVYDMFVHNQATTEELEAMNLCEVFNKKRNELTSLQGGEALGEGWDWCHGESCFRAIMSNYDAGYYAYLMGRAWALDIFESNFQADTLNKSAGRRYREKLLQPGASQPEMKTLYEYLGREPNLEAYYRWLGVGGQ